MGVAPPGSDVQSRIAIAWYRQAGLATRGRPSLGIARSAILLHHGGYERCCYSHLA